MSTTEQGRKANLPHPSSRFEAVMWLTLVLFYVCLAVLAVVILTFRKDNLEWLFAWIVLTFGSWVGSRHALEIHQDSKVVTPPAAKFRRPE